MNRWINHVREFAKKNNLTYSQALKHPNCSKSYGKKVGSGVGRSRVQPQEETQPTDYASLRPVQTTAVRVQPVIADVTIENDREVSTLIDKIIRKRKKYLKIYKTRVPNEDDKYDFYFEVAPLLLRLESLVSPNRVISADRLLSRRKIKRDDIIIYTIIPIVRPEDRVNEYEDDDDALRATEFTGSGVGQSRVRPYQQSSRYEQLERAIQSLMIESQYATDSYNELNDELTEIQSSINEYRNQGYTRAELSDLFRERHRISRRLRELENIINVNNESIENYLEQQENLTEELSDSESN